MHHLLQLHRDEYWLLVIRGNYLWGPEQARGLLWASTLSPTKGKELEQITSKITIRSKVCDSVSLPPNLNAL